MLTVEQFYTTYKKTLDLKLIAGIKGLRKKIGRPETDRPGLSLSGYLKNFSSKRILIFGRVELEYLNDLSSKLRMERLKAIVTAQTPAIMVSRGLVAPEELQNICEERDISLFRSSLSTMTLLSKLTRAFSEEFAKSKTIHGTFVEVHGVGLLLQGDSSIGKSEAALGLIKRGHRLVADDMVMVTRKEIDCLEGSSPELIRHHIEIRGIGIINIAQLYGTIAVVDKRKVDLLIKMEAWKENFFYDRVGLEERTKTLLGVKVPYLLLPVKPGRDILLLLETIALNHSLKKMGYHSAKEFNSKLSKAIASKGEKGLKGRKGPKEVIV